MYTLNGRPPFDDDGGMIASYVRKTPGECNLWLKMQQRLYTNQSSGPKKLKIETLSSLEILPSEVCRNIAVRVSFISADDIEFHPTAHSPL